MTQNKARRTNKIDFLPLPWAQEVSGSNPDAPTTSSCVFNALFLLLPTSANEFEGMTTAIARLSLESGHLSSSFFKLLF